MEVDEFHFARAQDRQQEHVQKETVQHSTTTHFKLFFFSDLQQIVLERN